MTGDSNVQYRMVDRNIIEEPSRAKLSHRAPHREPVSALLMLPELNQLVSCSRDGVVCTWNASNFMLQKRMQTVLARDQRARAMTRRFQKKKDKLKKFKGASHLEGTAAAPHSDAKQVTDYVTDAVYMSHCNRLAVASVDTSIGTCASQP